MRATTAIAAAAVLMSGFATVAAAKVTYATPEAKALFETLGPAYRRFTSLHVKTTGRMVLKVNGNVVSEETAVTEFRARRPNLLYAREDQVRNGVRKSRLTVCDGRFLWRWDDGSNRYTREPAPKALADIPQVGRIAEELAAFATGRPPTWSGALRPDVVLSVGQPTVLDGRQMDVLQVDLPMSGLGMAPRMSLLMDHETHVIRGMLMSGSGKEPTSGTAVSTEGKGVYDILEPNATLKASDFAFTPPAGAKQDKTVKRVSRPSK